MAQLKGGIVAALKADGAIAAIVGARVFPSQPPRTALRPRVIVQVTSDEYTHDLSGHTDQRIAIVTLHCQADTDLAAKALAIAVDAEARTFPSTVSSPVIKTSQQQSELDDEIGAGDGTELVIFTRVLEYRIDYRV